MISAPTMSNEKFLYKYHICHEQTFPYKNTKSVARKPTKNQNLANANTTINLKPINIS